MEEGKLPLIKLSTCLLQQLQINNYEAIIAAAKYNRDEKYTSLLPKPKRTFVNESIDNMDNSNTNINNILVLNIIFKK